MSIINLFSYRDDVAEGNVHDVYKYDELPNQLRAQIVHIWADAIGPFVHLRYSHTIANNEAWTWIHNSVAREHGTLKLAPGNSSRELCVNFLLDESVPVKKL